MDAMEGRMNIRSMNFLSQILEFFLSFFHHSSVFFFPLLLSYVEGYEQWRDRTKRESLNITAFHSSGSLM